MFKIYFYLLCENLNHVKINKIHVLKDISLFVAIGTHLHLSELKEPKLNQNKTTKQQQRQKFVNKKNKMRSCRKVIAPKTDVVKQGYGLVKSCCFEFHTLIMSYNLLRLQLNFLRQWLPNGVSRNFELSYISFMFGYVCCQKFSFLTR
jgi:hypothetical protein